MDIGATELGLLGQSRETKPRDGARGSALRQGEETEQRDRADEEDTERTSKADKHPHRQNSQTENLLERRDLGQRKSIGTKQASRAERQSRQNDQRGKANTMKVNQAEH